MYWPVLADRPLRMISIRYGEGRRFVRGNRREGFERVPQAEAVVEEALENHPIWIPH